MISSLACNLAVVREDDIQTSKSLLILQYILAGATLFQPEKEQICTLAL